MKKSRIFAVCMFTFLILLTSCTPKIAVPPQPQVTAEQEYENGINALAQGDWESAALFFNHAIKLNPEFGPAYSGMGLVLATRGEVDKALEYADKGLARHRIEATLVIKAEILTASKPEGWLPAALLLYDEAISNNPSKKSLRLQKADILLNAAEYEQAYEIYNDLSQGVDAIADSARNKAQIAFNFFKAAPSSVTAQKVLAVEKVTRADVAALLVDELGLAEIVNKKRPKSYSGGFAQTFQIVDPNAITDIAGQWAEAQIKFAAQTGAMDIFPDFTFRPDVVMTRKDLAMVLQNVLIIATGNERLATRFAGKSSPFNDVDRSHYAFNAICLVVDRNLMSYNSQTNEFELNKIVTGLEAQMAINALKQQL